MALKTLGKVRNQQIIKVKVYSYLVYLNALKLEIYLKHVIIIFCTRAKTDLEKIILNTKHVFILFLLPIAILNQNSLCFFCSKASMKPIFSALSSDSASL